MLMKSLQSHKIAVKILYFCRSFTDMPESKRLIRKTQRSSWISTIVSISLVLFLLGVLGILLLHAQKISNYVKENIEISLVLKADADSASIDELYKRVSTANYVKSAKLVSKEEAAATLKKELGEDFVSFLGYNPLFPSIDVRLRAEFADNATINSFLNSVKTNPAVKEVQYQASLVESINRNLKTITMILLAFSGLLIILQ